MEIKFLDTNNIVKLSQITFHQENVDIRNLINSKNKSNNNNASLTLSLIIEMCLYIK